jgi:DNA segregation ATPase FtsK/SpoIIIE-like protein
MWEGDTFCYEYHFMDFQYFDVSNMFMSKILYDDICALKSQGLSGIIEDGSQRSYFPTGFQFHVYGETLFEAAARLVVEEGVTSVSFLQRSLGIGYDKAARIVERLEELSIVSPLDGNRPRRVLVSAEKLEKILSDLKRG